MRRRIRTRDVEEAKSRCGRTRRSRDTTPHLHVGITMNLSLYLLLWICVGPIRVEGFTKAKSAAQNSGAPGVAYTSCRHRDFTQFNNPLRARSYDTRTLILPRLHSLPARMDAVYSQLKLPTHVAFICDGNSRWARARNLPTSAGHVKGAERLIQVLEFLKEANIQYCTLYGFSTENWSRPEDEIMGIFKVMERTARSFYARALEEGVRVIVLGDIQDERIPKGLKAILTQLEKDTGKIDTQLTVCVAVNYSGRQDLVNSCRRLAEAVGRGEIESEQITEETLSSMMYTSDVPDPDLIVRTSGECRLSNFLLWESAYAEIFFSPVFWPEFGRDSLTDALVWYDQRRRSFGGRIEAVAN